MKIFTKDKQGKGYFDNGRIIENKPIGFPQDNSLCKPFSNLFYWANAWSKEGGEIPEHPHKYFEIMSVIIKGEISHYDSKVNKWIKLPAGSVQVIQAGSGITHAEIIHPNSRIFQIWFDPDISKSAQLEPQYQDYLPQSFTFTKTDSVIIKHIIGNKGSVKLLTEGVKFEEITVLPGKEYTLDSNNIYTSIYCDGYLIVNEIPLCKDDFVVLKNENAIISNQTNKEIICYVMQNPLELTYKTYYERFMI
tara:strand:- start:64655 stop:65401 length:747 start_codon:yes stop_codon:yes gene_type:complete